MIAPLEPGALRLRGVSRRFKVVHERNATLKETFIRRQRARTTELWALRDVSFDIRPGESVALVGRNGSGKSTLLKMLAGIIPPHTGRIDSRGSIASMLELGAGFHPDFTGRENVFMNGAIHGLSEREIRRRLNGIIDFSEIEEFIDMPVRTYSSGMQMRLAFAVAAHVNPDILLLDEVLAVGDEAFQRKCMGRIHDFREGGGTLVFVSHDAGAVETVCDRAILIENGRVVEDDSPSVVMAQYHRRLAETTTSIGAALEAVPEEADELANDQADPVSPLGGWGTGDVVITSVAIHGPNGPSESLVSGDPIDFVITLESSRRVHTPNVGLEIATPDGTTVFGTNTRIAALDLESIDGRMTLTFQSPVLALQSGHFEVKVAVLSHDERTVYHWLDNAATLNVFSRHSGVGIVALDGVWLVADGAASGDRF